MGLINQEGCYKGYIIDGGLGQSSGGLPQEEWFLKATRVWDDENGEYLPVDEGHDEITAYLVLMSYKDKETKSAQQVKKILGWDGASYPELAETERANVELSFKAKFGTGDYSENLQVSWVDEPDASPTRAVSKISKEDAAALQARYAPALAATKTPAKAVSAKDKRKDKKGITAVAERTSASPTIPKGKKPKPVKAVSKCTGQEAYTACYELTRDEINEVRLNKLWLEEVAKVNADEAKITEEEWFEIRERVLKTVGKI